MPPVVAHTLVRKNERVPPSESSALFAVDSACQTDGWHSVACWQTLGEGRIEQGLWLVKHLSLADRQLFVVPRTSEFDCILDVRAETSCDKADRDASNASRVGEAI